MTQNELVSKINRIIQQVRNRVLQSAYFGVKKPVHNYGWANVEPYYCFRRSKPDNDAVKTGWCIRPTRSRVGSVFISARVFRLLLEQSDGSVLDLADDSVNCFRSQVNDSLWTCAAVIVEDL